ncbi:hypothetical protein BDB00DRAFT_800105 [Zychaea mexicana]|uniref:uncharacterized protein n=1 Tax=Zychaea mexicana TaxID=64656 RepID=UPI0022FF3C29|nr:uncharacterized protein BDB00DRAFT_800105 [Zychaea mexicana]KAI9498389.1 hypothetical protein BDB00DRAFT_800105 [Zychaea mexicana]
MLFSRYTSITAETSENQGRDLLHNKHILYKEKVRRNSVCRKIVFRLISHNSCYLQQERLNELVLLITQHIHSIKLVFQEIILFFMYKELDECLFFTKTLCFMIAHTINSLYILFIAPISYENLNFNPLYKVLLCLFAHIFHSNVCNRNHYQWSDLNVGSLLTKKEYAQNCQVSIDGTVYSIKGHVAS